MKLAHFDIYAYTLPFEEPIVFKDERLEFREGFLVKLRDESGVSGWGEVSPLPGFSSESLEEAGSQLYELASSCVGATFLEDQLLFEDRDLTPSVRFGFELAIYNIQAKAQGKSLPQLFSQNSGTSVELNGLLAAQGSVLEEARRMRDAGYAAVKLKVGTREVEEDAARVIAVAEILGESAALRLDANRAWNFEEAVEFFEAISRVRYEYVEEPLAEPEGLARLVNDYDVRVALDESLVGMRAGELDGHRYARAVVLKPTLLGGVSRTLALAREAERLKILPVVSSAYETGIGTEALISLAASIRNGEIPAGLDTYRRLADDVYEPALDLSASHVSVDQLVTPRTINYQRLEHVWSSVA